MFFTSESRSTGRRPGSGASAVGGPVATFNPTRKVQEDTLSYAATRRKRFTAGVIAGALALTVTPILGFTGTASALNSATGTGSVCANPPSAEPFTDVSDTDPSNAEITCLVDSGVTTGVTATTYEPNSSVTRRQMALFLKRVADSADAKDSGGQVTALPAGDGTTPYTDIAGENADVKKAIDQLDEAGIAQGVTASTFVPDAPVTRRQMAKFLVRLQTYLTGAASVPTASKDYFTDDNGDSGEGDLNILAEEGVFLGDGAGHVNPGANITRHQMANVLVRKFQVMFENGDIQRLFTATTAGATIRPELTGAKILQTVTPGNATPTQPAGTYVIDFDEPLHWARLRRTSRRTSRRDHVLHGCPGFASVQPGGLAVVVVFTDAALQSPTGAAGLSVATVVQGAVLDANGNSNPEGDAAIGSGASSGVTAGVTAAPDLTAVGPYRQANMVGHTVVDFTFDEAAVSNGAGFFLVLQDNSIIGCTSPTTTAQPSGGTVPGGSGTTMITVDCLNPDITGPNPGGTPLSAANVARGAVCLGAVVDTSASTVPNPLEAANSGNGGNGAGPDLVSATFIQGANDSAIYVFDANITSTAFGSFAAYSASGAEIYGGSATISATDPHQVLVTFGSPTALDTAVGASVYPGAASAGATPTRSTRWRSPTPPPRRSRPAAPLLRTWSVFPSPRRRASLPLLRLSRSTRTWNRVHSSWMGCSTCTRPMVSASRWVRVAATPARRGVPPTRTRPRRARR